MKQVLTACGRGSLVASFGILTILGIFCATVGVLRTLSLVFSMAFSSALIALAWLLGGLVLIRIGRLLFEISEGEKPVQRIRDNPSEILRMSGNSVGTSISNGMEVVLAPLIVLAALLFFVSIPTIFTAISGGIIIAVMFVFVTVRDVIEFLLTFLLGVFS